MRILVGDARLINRTQRLKPSRRGAALLFATGASFSIFGTALAGAPVLRSRLPVSVAARPRYDVRIHYVGEAWLSVDNWGNVGDGHQGAAHFFSKDETRLGITRQPGFEFPGGTQLDYMHTCGIAIGGISGVDTLVSGRGLFGEAGLNEFASSDTLRESSSSAASQYFNPRSHAQQEYSAIYFDTVAVPDFEIDFLDHRPHKPLGLEVHQTSYGWSDGFSKRFVIIDSWFRNVSTRPIQQPAVALIVYPWISYVPDDMSGQSADDDICGLLRVAPGIVPGSSDTVDLAWAADNDGDPGVNGLFATGSPRGVVGARVLRSPADGAFNFNWWAFGGSRDTSLYINWGPRRRANIGGFAGSLGFPLGDRNRYRMMTNGEIDYDQVYSALDQGGTGWSPPLPGAASRDLANGQGIEFALSYGPLPDLAPGDSIPFTYALIVGANFHTNSRNFADNFDPLNPKKYLDGLNFSDLITNARWADWVFDNPGVDTDGDGYRGKFYLVDCKGPGGSGPCDTVWYKGDGIPDWRGPQGPPAPAFELTTIPHQGILRWTGALTETVKDPISRIRDHEGYRVYTSRIDVNDQYSLVASWDKEDFTRWAYDSTLNDWKQVSYPLTIPQWQRELNNPAFDPSHYSQPSFETAYRDTFIDTVRDVQGTVIKIVRRERFSYWLAEGPNRGNSYYGTDRQETNPIQRVAVRDTVIEGDTLTYGVYEITIDNLNGGVPLYFAVTAFDFGDYAKNVPSIESSPSNNAQYGIPIYEAEVVTDSNLKVSVYPNPYKSRFRDAFGNWQSYHGQGYEAPGRVMTPFDRRIWFINLPDTATIRIYTLDGDLVREIDHPDKFLTTYSSAVGWDLISRNTQEVESGIYIYRVDSRLGVQIGKIVIIK